MARTSSRAIVGTDAYATAADFEQIFTEDMGGLFLLSFLLAGDRDQAEECFVAAIGESTKRKRIFKEWARSWARRSVIQTAIRLILLRQHPESTKRNPAAALALHELPGLLQAEVSAIVALAPLERFVFVMSVLERYPDHDCSILLGCTRRQVIDARARALQQLGRTMILQNNEADAALARYENPRPGIELTIAQYFPMQAWNKSLSHGTLLWP